MYRIRVLIVAACLGLGVAMASAAIIYFRRPIIPNAVAPRLEELQRLTALVTTRVQVQQRQECVLAGKTGRLRIALWAEGVVLLGPSLQHAELTDVDERARIATLVLPQPRVISCHLDVSRSRFDVIDWSGLWWLFPDHNLRLQAESSTLRRAQDSLATGHIDKWQAQSREQTRLVVEQFASSAGWAIRLRWSH